MAEPGDPPPSGAGADGAPDSQPQSASSEAQPATDLILETEKASTAHAPAVEKVKEGELDLKDQKLAESPPAPVEKLSKIDADREGVRGDLARGLLWLLTLLIGGLLVFVGIGRAPADVLTQSVFPSLVTLTGTALGFYFGSQSNKDAGPKS